MARVLIVDDNLLCRTLLRRIFSDGQHEVVGEAENGLEAPRRVRELHPDLVTLDLVMPGRDGLTTLRHLMLIDPGLAVIVCSASLHEANAIAALRLGARGFIAKPFDCTTVLAAATDALNSCAKGELPPPTLHRMPASSATTRAARVHAPPLNSTAEISMRDLESTCRGFAGGLRDILEQAVDTGLVTLDQLLTFDYQQISGSEIQGLQRLFDVSRVIGQGFDPPKFQTGYADVVDRRLTQRMDAVLAGEPRLTFAVAFDLNTYAPAHNSAFSRDCTGDPKRDLVQNRTKRFFLESAELIHVARMDLGIDLPPRIHSRSEIKRAGASLTEPINDDHVCVSQRYPRDTGELLSTLSLPLYVKGQRFGVATLGWDPHLLCPV